MKLKIEPHSKYLSIITLFLIYFVQLGLLIVARRVAESGIGGVDDIFPAQVFVVSPLLFLSLLFLCWQLFLEEHSNHKIVAVLLALLSGFCLYLSFTIVGIF